MMATEETVRFFEHVALWLALGWWGLVRWSTPHRRMQVTWH